MYGATTDTGAEPEASHSAAVAANYDKDGDGKLSREEYAALRHGQKAGDLDGDGMVDQTEMAQMDDFKNVTDSKVTMVQVDEEAALTVEDETADSPGHEEEDECDQLCETEQLLIHGRTSRHLDKESVIRRMVRYRYNRRHYTSLGVFVLFCLIFFGVTIMQHQHERVCAMGRTTRVGFDALAAGTKEMRDLGAFWTWLENDFAGAVFGNPWSSTTQGVESRGYRMDDVNNLIGGVLITAAERQTTKCSQSSLFNPNPARTVCYEKTQAAPDYSNSVHKVYLPSVLSPKQITAVLAYHKEVGTIGAGSYGIQIEYMIYGPSVEAISLVSLQLESDVTGHWKAYPSITSIPRFLYPQGYAHAACWVVLQLVFVGLWCMLVLSLYTSVQNTWHISLPELLPCCIKGDMASQAEMKRILQAPTYDVAPGDARTFWVTSMPLHVLTALAVFFWIHLIIKYQQLAIVTQLHATDLTTVNGLSSSETDIKSLIWYSSQYELLYQHVSRATTGLTWWFHNYFVILGCTSVMLTIRIFEYLHFQKKLSVITETFMNGLGELAHLFLVLGVTINGCAFAMFLILGTQVLAFGSFHAAVGSLWATVFNTWKVKPKQLKNISTDIQLIAELLVMFFRLFVIMLLLKMLFAMIFEGYKTNATKKSKKGNSVWKDVLELGGHIANWLNWRLYSCISTATCYVSPVELEVALRDAECTSDQLQLDDVVKQLRKAFPSKEFGIGHAEWVLNRYGTIDPYDNGTQARPPSVEMREMIKKTFDDFDQDNSGYIDQRELRQAFVQMGIPEMKPDRMRMMLNQIGCSKTNPELDIDQFCAVLTGHRMDGSAFLQALKAHLAPEKKGEKKNKWRTLKILAPAYVALNKPKSSPPPSTKEDVSQPFWEEDADDGTKPFWDSE